MIKLVNVSKFYHNEGNVVLGLHRANVEFKMGEFVAITGESGSGKSTLLNVISGIDSYEEGEVYFNGQETSHYDETDWQEYRKKNIGFVFQNYHLIDSYTVLENVESVMIINGLSKKERRHRAIEILKQVGLDKHLKHQGTKLSGGEKQRLAIARAIAKDTPVIVADEPTGNLDSQTGLQIMQILKELSKTKLVVMVTHNYELIDDFVSRVVRLYDGKIVENKILYDATIDDQIEYHHPETSAAKKAFPFAFWNFKNQPKITIFSILVTLITTFLVSFMFASLLETRMENMGGYNRFFPNSPPTRIIVAKDDEITDDEVDEIKKISNVDYIVRADLIYNTNIYYEVTGDKSSFNRALFRNVVEISEQDLVEGSLPNDPLEVVLTNDVNNETQKLLNKKIKIRSAYYYGHGGLVEFDEYLVVGIVEAERDPWAEPHIYFTEERLKYLNQLSFTQMNEYQLTLDQNFHGFQTLSFSIDDSLPNGQVNITIYHMDDPAGYPKYEDGIDVELKTYYSKYEYILNKYQYVQEQDVYQLVRISLNQHEFNLLTNDANRQISVYVKNESLINQTMTRLENLGYIVFNPSNHAQREDLLTTVLNVIYTIFFSIIILGIYLIASVIINAIFKNKLRDSIILKSMGLDSYSANLVTIIQVTTYFIISILLLNPAIILLSKNNPTFAQIYRSFHWYHYVLLFVINIVLGIFVATRVNRSIRKKSIVSAMMTE